MRNSTEGDETRQCRDIRNRGPPTLRPRPGGAKAPRRTIAHSPIIPGNPTTGQRAKRPWRAAQEPLSRPHAGERQTHAEGAARKRGRAYPAGAPRYRYSTGRFPAARTGIRLPQGAGLSISCFPATRSDRRAGRMARRGFSPCRLHGAAFVVQFGNGRRAMSKLTEIPQFVL